MLKKLVATGIVLLLAGSIALAETVRGMLNKIEDDKITVTVREKGKKGKGTEKTFDLAKKVKHSKIKGKDEFEDSSMKALKATLEENKKGTFVILEVEDGKVTEIKHGAFKKRKKKEPTETETEKKKKSKDD